MGVVMNFKDSVAIRLIEDKLGCGFWRRDVGSDEMEWSRGLFKLYGLDPDKDRPSYTLMRETQHPEDRLTFEKIDGNVRAGTLFDREYRVTLRDGGTRRLAHRGEVIFDHKGAPTFDVAVVWNVADRPQLLDEVLSDERRLKIILEALDYFISFLRSDGLGMVPGEMLEKLALRPSGRRRT
jgi:PAS domain-containing protein